MMTEALPSFLANAALLTLLTLAYLMLSSSLTRLQPLLRQLVLGAAFGAAACAGMLMPVELSHGVILDARALVLGLAAPFGGPWAGLIAGGLAAAGRWHIGGLGALPGAVGCLASAGVGIAWRRWRRGSDGAPTLLELPAIGFASALAGLSSVALLPLPLAWKMAMAAAPITLLVQPLAALLLGWLLSFERRLRRAERTAELAAERFRDFSEAAGDWYWELGPDLRFTYVSETVEARTGRPPSFYIGKLRSELFEAPIPRSIQEHVAVLERREPFRDFRYSRTDADGRRRHYSLSGKPMRGPKGEFVGYRGVGSDVTAHLEQLAERTEQLKAALESVEDGVSVLDAEFKLVAWNELFVTLTGTPRDVLRVGLPCEELIRLQARGGLFGAGVEPEARVAERMESILRREPRQQLLSRNGRMVEMRRRPMPAGGYMTSFRDVTAEKLRERELTLLAMHDRLTGLANRAHFEEELDRALASPARRALTLLFIDLDGFKMVNDEIGHEAGDRLLAEAGRRIAGCVRGGDLAARLGGDEFVILLKGEDARRPEAIVERLEATMAAPIQISGRQLRIGASVGVAQAREGDDREALLRAADAAMYAAKRAGRPMDGPPLRETRRRKLG